jgi:hypothetical protein
MLRVWPTFPQAFFNASMREFNDPKGTWPPAANLPRLARSTSRLLKRVESLLGKKRGELRLLDVGCSSGAFINMAGQLGMNCEGVEPAAEAVSAAGNKGLMVYQGFLGDLSLPTASLTDKDAVSAFRPRLWKILAEALNMPARLYGRGQEMEVFLGKV